MDQKTDYEIRFCIIVLNTHWKLSVYIMIN